MTDRSAFSDARETARSDAVTWAASGSAAMAPDTCPDTCEPTPSSLLQTFRQVRSASERLAAPLSAEDQAAQSMPDASPTKWHLAHTTWFFETFILVPRGYTPFDPVYGYLFNSYYEALGDRQPRPQRGLLTRPSCAEVMAYRRHVDHAMIALLERATPDRELRDLMALGFAHEEQHQELLLMDIQHLFAQSALRPAYRARTPAATHTAPSAETAFLDMPGGLLEIGHAGEGFSFDNEGPRHKVYLKRYRLAQAPVTNAAWLQFIAEDGYGRPELWLSDGWAQVQAEGWRAPLYWQADGKDWRRFGLNGLGDVQPAAPVAHVSYYEADAFARWAGRRLPTEAEWEAASPHAGCLGAFMDDNALEPTPTNDTMTASPMTASPDRLSQMFGGVWEWTASPYVGYPGFRAPQGAVGEYNGKFMINQMVLRGGSYLTPRHHVRATYRNFFHPHQRWQAAGVRLADD